MKKVFIAILFLLISLSASPVSAHLAGQPPFFKVNGKYSILYPVPLTSLTDFNLPQDLASDKYLVNQKIDFEMDTNNLPTPQDVISQTQFFWDFGDNTSGSGLKNSHIYKKPGSYILTIKAQYITDPQPQLMQSMLINILPTPDYQLPVAKIKINGQESQDPLTDVIKADFSKEIQLDGTGSISSSKIVSYFWDLGDQKSSTQSTLKYKYDPSAKIIFPVLRIKTEDGFIADSFVEIENDPNATNLSQPNLSNLSSNSGQKVTSLPKIILIGAGLVGLLGAGGLIYLKKKRAQAKIKTG